MGTKIQCKSYLPGYHPMIDLNENAKGWSRCYEDNMLSGHLCNGFMLRPVNEYSEYDKEMLKRTMLEHEAIFRKQVYELHRLYRIQRELMDECQKKGLYRYSIPSDTSQSNSFSSQLPCEGTTKIWKMSHLPILNTSYGKAPFAASDDTRSSNFLKEGSVQSGPISLENGVSLKDGELDSKLQKSPRRMFDLQLPADVYIDSEDSERSGKKDFADSSSRFTVSPSRTCSAVPENDVKLTLNTGLGPYCEKDNKIPNLWTQKGLSAQSLADLNKSIKDICFEGVADTTSNHFLGVRNHSEENQGHKLSSKSRSYCEKDNKIPNSWTQKGLSAQSLADLNKSIKDICCEGVADTTSNHFLGVRNHSEENQGHKLSSKSRSYCEKDNKIPNSWTQKGLSAQSLADLNKSIKDICCEGVADTTSNHFLGVRNHSEENQGHKLSSKSRSYCEKDNKIPNSWTQKGLSAQSLADLNKSIKDICCEGVADTTSNHFLGVRNHSEENQGHKLSSKSRSYCEKDNKIPNSWTQKGLSAQSLADLNKSIKDICCEGVADTTSNHFLGVRNHSEENQGHKLSSKSRSYCEKDNKIPNSWTQKGLSAQSLADLNKSIKDICFEGVADTTSNHFLGVRNHSEENQGHKLSSKSNTNFLGLQSAFSKDKHGDEGSSSSFLHADKGEIRRERPFFNGESAQSRSSLSLFSPSLCDDKFPTSSETVQQRLKNSHGIALSHQNKTQTWFRQKPTYGIETSGISTHLATSNNSAVTAAPSIPASFSILPQTNSSSSASSLVSSLTKPVSSISHIPVAVQALPCLNGSATLHTQNMISNVAIQNIGTDRETWQTCRDSHQRAGIEAPSYLNGPFAGFRLDSKSEPYLQLPSVTFGKPNHNDTGDSSAYGNSIGHEPQKCFKSLQFTDVKSLHNVNLNQPLPNGIENDLTVQKHTVLCNLEQDFESSSKGISWLGKKPAYNDSIDLKKHASQMDLSFVHGHSQLMSSSNTVAPESERKQEKGTGPSLCNPQDFTSAFQIKEIKMQRNEISDNMGSRKILGFPILDEVQQNAVSHQECSLTKNNNYIDKDIYCTDLTCDMKERSSEKAISTGSLITEKGAENISKSFRNIINLNAEVTSMDDPRLSEFSPKSEMTVPLPLPLPRVSAKDATEVNLEIPISQAEVNIMSHQEYIPSSKTDGSQETECSHDTFAREAAENIVAMSVDVHAHLAEITWDGLPSAQWDTLFWFAEVVSSNADNVRVPKTSGDCGSEPSDDDGLDFFEAMTLKLEEIKVDDRCCQPKEFENKKDEPGAASLLLMRPRRGQGRRRRQRRDFQKDVLPSLASLSRHEVTEDLQTIGGLMKASGKTWQTGLTRRNTGRNGLHSQAKGRRQPRSLAVALSETQVTSPPVHPISTDLEVHGRNMVGWGRTTRRCRRPRCPPGNVSAPLT